MKGKTFWVLVLALLAGGGVLGWQSYQARLSALPPGFAAGNGRVESVQVDVTTKEPGRVETILVHEGDMVHAGQVVAKMDTVTLGAELARAQATVAAEEAKGLEVAADITQAESLLKLAEVELARERNLLARKATSREDYDIKDTLAKTRRAALDGEKARLNTARKSVEAAKAEAARIQSRICARSSSPSSNRRRTGSVSIRSSSCEAVTRASASSSRRATTPSTGLVARSARSARRTRRSVR